MNKPKLLISACLEFEKVRYNGQSISSQIIKDLVPFVDFIKVCPEQAIGLGVPREPIRIVKKENELRLIQHKTNKDVTDEMNNFSSQYVDNLKEVDGFIFKSKSPSMGVSNIKVYSGMKGSPVVDRCGGFFASRVAEKFFGYPIEEEDRLRNKKIRDNFLTKIYLFSSYRNALKNNKLKEFHEKNRLLLKFYNQNLYKKLNLNNNYFEILKKITRRPPNSEDIAAFFSNLIGSKEKIINRYRANKVSYETMKEVSKFLIKDKNLLNQTFFNPYPEELVLEVEDDRNKNYWKYL